MKAIYTALAVVVLLGGAFLIFSSQKSSRTTSTSQGETGQMQYPFENPKKSAHYESNTPAHGAILAGVPINVVIDFNFDLAKPSEIKVLKDGKDYGLDETIIDDNKLAMRRKIDPTAPDGLYKVEYKACWPNGSCHNGNFQFVIDKTLGAGFVDQTSKPEVEIKMSQIVFSPKNIKISKGTKVTWLNDDGVSHFVNTDSHPGHTYYKAQNSPSLVKGASYTVTFETPGIYPYHCSAHADTMTGNILVE